MSNDFDVDSFLSDTKNPKENIGKDETFNPDQFLTESQPAPVTPKGQSQLSPVAPNAFDQYAVPVIGGLATAGNMAMSVPKAVGQWAKENPELSIPAAYFAKDWAKEQAAKGATALKNTATNVFQQGMDMASKMRQAAANRVVGFGASGAAVPAAVAAGGAALTGIAGGQMAAMTPEQRKAYYDSTMMGAMSGDAGLAAAIMNRGQ